MWLQKGRNPIHDRDYLHDYGNLDKSQSLGTARVLFGLEPTLKPADLAEDGLHLQLDDETITFNGRCCSPSQCVGYVLARKKGSPFWNGRITGTYHHLLKKSHLARTISLSLSFIIIGKSCMQIISKNKPVAPIVTPLTTHFFQAFVPYFDS